MSFYVKDAFPLPTNTNMAKTIKDKQDNV